MSLVSQGGVPIQIVRRKNAREKIPFLSLADMLMRGSRLSGSMSSDRKYMIEAARKSALASKARRDARFAPDRELIIRMLAEGKLITEIWTAMSVSVSYSALRKYLDTHGLERKKTTRQRFHDEIKTVKRMLANGCTSMEIGKRIQMSDVLIRQHMRESRLKANKKARLRKHVHAKIRPHVKTIKKMVLDGATGALIGETIKVDSCTVNRYIKKMGLRNIDNKLGQP